MQVLAKTLFMAILLTGFYNLPALASSKWENGDYFCEDPKPKYIVEGGIRFTGECY